MFHGIHPPGLPFQNRLKGVPLPVVIKTVAPKVAFIAAQHGPPEKHDRVVEIGLHSNAVCLRDDGDCCCRLGEFRSRGEFIPMAAIDPPDQGDGTGEKKKKEGECA